MIFQGFVMGPVHFNINYLNEIIDVIHMKSMMTTIWVGRRDTVNNSENRLKRISVDMNTGSYLANFIILLLLYGTQTRL